MKNNFELIKPKICITDSGIGGLSILTEVVKQIDFDTIFYLGDGENLPYGNKSCRELQKILFNNLLYAQSFNVDAVLIACNTMSCLLNEKLKDLFNFEIYGVYPPVYKIKRETNNALLIATEFTALNYKKDINTIGLKYLASDIENNIFNLSKVNLGNHFKYINEKIDKVILGCTHYHFLEEEIKKYFNAKTTSGNEYLLKNLKKSNIFKNFSSNNKKFEILDHFDHQNGDFYEILLKMSKNNKKRVVFIGKQAKKYYEVCRYLLKNHI